MFEAERYVTVLEASAAAVCFQVDVTFCKVPFAALLRWRLFRSCCFCLLSTCLHSLSLQNVLFGHVGHSLRRLQVN